MFAQDDYGYYIEHSANSWNAGEDHWFDGFMFDSYLYPEIL